MVHGDGWDGSGSWAGIVCFRPFAVGLAARLLESELIENVWPCDAVDRNSKPRLDRSTRFPLVAVGAFPDQQPL